jgi:GxxExxY protein
LGHGFLEKIYHNALIIELRKAGLKFETKRKINVFYNEEVVGEFEADLIVEEKVILELKAKETLVEAHEAQLVNYLRATEIEIGLLLNFGKTPQFKRKIFSNEKKTLNSKLQDTDLIKNLLN